MKSRTAPHWIGTNTVSLMMRRVLLALLPMQACMVFYFGIGAVSNLLLLTIFSAAFEATALWLRGRPTLPGLSDGSVAVTALLLSPCLPPGSPWWVLLCASLFAVVFAKHVYGGLGQNVFNPAMVGYVAVLVAFPQQVADWPSLPATMPDALSGATPLDSVKMQLGQMRTMSEILGGSDFGWLAGAGWEWVNITALAGGLWLIRKGVITWHAPGGMLLSLGALYFVAYAITPATQPSPLFGLLSGGTMLAAFFIVTDPVSGAASPAGRIIFGAGTGALCYAMRTWGAYPDGIAFAVLLMNMAVPLIDRYTLPRVYGHKKRP